MAVYQRKRKNPLTGEVSTHWVAHVEGEGPDGEKRRIVKRAPQNTRDSAVILEARLREELRAGIERARRVPTLQKVAGEFLDHAKQNLEFATWKYYRQNLVYLVDAFSKLPLTAIRVARLAKFKEKMRADGYSVRTINAALTTLGTIFNFCLDREYISSRPRIKRLPAAERKPKFFTAEGMSQLLEAAKRVGPECYAVIRTLYVTGMRIGELCGLRWEDVDFTRPLVHIQRAVNYGIVKRTKNRKSRIVGLTREAVTVLREQQLRTRILGSEYVFPNAEGSLRSRPDFDPIVHAAGREAGLGRWGPHRLRHTAASHLAMRGLSLVKIRDFLGHGSVSMVEIYAHLVPQEVAEQAAALLELPASAASK